MHFIVYKSIQGKTGFLFDLSRGLVRFFALERENKINYLPFNINGRINPKQL